MHQVRAYTPGRNLKGREYPHRWTLTCSSGQVEAQFRHPRLRILHREDKPPWVLEVSLGQAERLEKISYYSYEMCGCCCQQLGRREPCSGSCHLPTLPNPNEVNSLGLLTPQHNLVLDLGKVCPGKIHSLAEQRQTRPRPSVSSRWDSKGHCQHMHKAASQEYTIA